MRISRIIFPIGLLLAILIGVASPGYAQSQQVDKIEISQVDGGKFPMVTLYVRILDASGKKVPGLSQDQFKITEDGKEVKITAFQASNASSIVTLMMMDVSSSMSEDQKIASAREAGITFVDLMRKEDQVALWLFNHLVQRASDFTNDKNLLKNRISAITANGGTAWYDALIQCSQEIAKQTGRRSLLLLTDGIDEHSTNSFSNALIAARNAQVPVYAIGLGSWNNLNKTELEKLATETGGKYYEAPTADQLKQLYAEISQSTQEEYVITYESPRGSFDGTRRNIDIVVGGKTGSGGWTEMHLLNIESNPSVALIAAIPLIALLFVPMLVSRISKIGRRRTSSPTSTAYPAPQFQDGQMQTGFTQQSEALPTFCIQCGVLLKPGARFCISCGAQQFTSQSVLPAQPTSAYGSPPYGQQPSPPVSGLVNPPQNQGPYMPPPPRTNLPPSLPPAAHLSMGEATKFCSKCGNPLRPGVRFCSKCGTSH